MGGRAVIHINGKDYDAHDGSLIRAPHTQKNIDGVIAKPSARKHHQPAQHTARTVKKATTLMRTAVKKPQILSDIRHTPIITPSRRVEPATQKPHIPHIKKSSVITHFSPIEPQTVSMAPAPEPMSHASAASHHQPTVTSHEAHIRKQLERATAHTSESPKRGIRGKAKAMSPRKRKGASLAAGLAALVLIGGFIVYQSIPQLSFAVATRRAGFSAMLPKYTPGGFGVKGPVTYGPGQIIISFASRTDDRNYRIEQTPSSLTTDALKDKVTGDSGGQYQTYSQGGLTIFVGQDFATWVDRGVLFTLKGNSGLSSAQIASIASSM